MGLSIQIHDPADNTDHVKSLATASGWHSFSRWIAALPSGRFTRLKELCEEGSVKGTEALASELNQALAFPCTADIRHTARELSGTIGVGDADEIATVVD